MLWTTAIFCFVWFEWISAPTLPLSLTLYRHSELIFRLINYMLTKMQMLRSR